MLFEEFRNYAKNLPELEMERFAHIQRKSQSSVAMTHPATENRIKFLETRPVNTSKIQLTETEYDELIVELKTFEVPLQKILLGI